MYLHNQMLAIATIQYYKPKNLHKLKFWSGAVRQIVMKPLKSHIFITTVITNITWRRPKCFDVSVTFTWVVRANKQSTPGV